jgi:hypothetical protein
MIQELLFCRAYSDRAIDKTIYHFVQAMPELGEKISGNESISCVSFYFFLNEKI